MEMFQMSESMIFWAVKFTINQKCIKHNQPTRINSIMLASQLILHVIPLLDHVVIKIYCRNLA